MTHDTLTRDTVGLVIGFDDDVRTEVVCNSTIFIRIVEISSLAYIGQSMLTFWSHTLNKVGCLP